MVNMGMEGFQRTPDSFESTGIEEAEISSEPSELTLCPPPPKHGSRALGSSLRGPPSNVHVLPAPPPSAEGCTHQRWLCCSHTYYQLSLLLSLSNCSQDDET